jgi:hypothetical protein
MWSVGVYVGNRIILRDGFLLDQDRNFLAAGELAIHPGQIEEIDNAASQSLRQMPGRALPGRALAIIPPGPGYRIYGHWLADMLPRLSVVELAGVDITDLWYPLPADTPAFALALLHLYGVPPDRMVFYQKAEMLQAEEWLMPTLVHNGVQASPVLENFVKSFKRRLRLAGHDLAASNAQTRLFLARAGGNRRLLNRRKIESMAQEAGFLYIRPETMSLKEQFALFASAREIVGEYGSAFHTSLLSQRSAVVCGLRGNQMHPGFIQAGIGGILGQKTGWVFGESGGGPGPYDYTIPEPAFAACLRQAFGCKLNGKSYSRANAKTAPDIAESAKAPAWGGERAKSRNATEAMGWATLRWIAIARTYVKASTALAASLPESDMYAVREGDIIEAEAAELRDRHLVLTAARVNGQALPERLRYIIPSAWKRS